MKECPDKKTEKRMKIIETAYRLFQQKSVSSTAVDDVVKAAGIARGTFYLYFKDKSDLLEQIILFKSTETMRQLLTEAQRRFDSKEVPFTEIAGSFIDMYIDFLVLHADVLAVVTKNISSCLKLFPSFYDKEIEAVYNKITEMFVQSGCPEERVHRTVYIIADLIGSVCSDAILGGKPFTIDEIRGDVKTAALSIVSGALGGNREKEDEL